MLAAVYHGVFNLPHFPDVLFSVHRTDCCRRRRAMSADKTYGIVNTLALVGMLAVPPVAMALEAQEYTNIQSQCQREAQDYGVAPEQIEEYVSGCVLAYGGMPEAAPEPEAPPVDAGADASAADEQDTGAVDE
jgi:hypothetical protein